MNLFASLPMYDLPELRQETDALWALLASHLRKAGVANVPDALSREDSDEVFWSRPDLLISQTCGYPLMRRYRDLLRPLATPVYAVDGCEGPCYSSAVLVSASSKVSTLDELRGTMCAVNSPQSQSGYNAIRALVAPLARQGRFFSEVKVSGSHRTSMSMVAAGEADVCAVDCVSYALLRRYVPASVDGTRALDYTPSCPGLPIVVPAGMDPEQVTRVRKALKEAMVDPAGAKVREALFIAGIEEMEIDDYGPVLEMEVQADAVGYTELR